MISEPSNFTWQSLHEYIERRIAGTLNTLQLIEKDPHVSSFAQSKATLEHQLELLRWCLPLVSKMQNRKDMQAIRPMMSLDLIRLSCRHQHDSEDHSPDFAWILPIADGRYSLKQINPQEPESSSFFEGDLIQIVEKIEKLVKEKCAKEAH